ncbi:MAG TPA: pyridoxal-phosphate dependent enzyme, partial [Nakamurella sp.]|nr:pyridoxal-phosphate dependent enzyme [Nakamurella sp.]
MPATGAVADGRLWLGESRRSWPGEAVSSPRDFHAGLPGYRPTPLHSVDGLAREFGVGAVMVKDESRRLGLPAFKVLGASWGVFQALRARLPDAPAAAGTLDDLREHLAALGDVTLLTATAGNHGRAVARMARWLGLPCLVLVPSSLAAPTVRAIGDEGVRVQPIRGSYDDAVTEAAALADADGGFVLVQDTAWPGYEQVPAWIVEGYDTLFQEVDDDPRGREPDLVVVPSGVGSLLAAAIRHYHAPGRPSAPAILSVEPDGAACVLASARAGHPVSVDTAGYVTVMAGLNAGTVSTAAWPVIRAGLDAATAVTDEQA